MKVFRMSLAIALLSLLIIANSVWAFKQGIHQYNITEPVLGEMGFDTDSADEVGDSNWYTDVAEPHVEAAHADNNNLSGASARLRRKMQEIVDNLQSCERRTALDRLGEALHTVQDVYSHSNAVDNGIPIPDILNMVNGTAFCDPNNNFAPDGLVTGYFNLAGYLALSLSITQCTGMPEGMCCHKELNKDNASQPNGDLTEKAQDEAKIATRNYIDLLFAKFDQQFSEENVAYYKKMLKKKQKKTVFVIDSTGSMEDDISQVKSAVNAELDAIIAGDEAPTLGLVTFKDSVNNHGLSCDITDFRHQINSISVGGGGDCPESSNSALSSALNHFPTLRGDVTLRGGNIMLATDASANNPYLTRSVAARARSYGVSISYILTGDCIEAERSAARSSIQTYSANDISEANDQFSSHKTQLAKSSSDPLESDSATILYQALADQTGGVCFIVDKDEVGTVVPIYLQMTDLDTEVTFSSRVKSDATSSVDTVIIVDSSMTSGNLIFMVTSGDGSQLPTMELIRPDGSSVNADDAEVNVTQISSLIAFDITAPQTGEWKVRLSNGESTYLVRSFAKTDFRINSLKFLETPETPVRHVELVPIQGSPIVGDEVFVQIRFTQPPVTAVLQLRKEDGSVITSPELSLVEGSSRTYQASFIVPNESFYLKLTGDIGEGNYYQREVPVRVVPQTVALVISPENLNASIGDTASFDLFITNYSNTDATYTLSGSSKLGYDITGQEEVSVKTGETVSVPVSVSVPDNALEDSNDELVFIAVDKSDSSVSNTALAYLHVTAADITVPVYRFYSEHLKKHFFTTDENEKEHLIANAADVWRYEGIAYHAYTPQQSARLEIATVLPVHRFYSEALQTHLFTVHDNEKAHLIANAADVWRYEGVAFYVPASSQEGTVPVYRFYSDMLKVHFYTIDENEKNHLIDKAGNVWRFEGIAYYVFP